MNEESFKSLSDYNEDYDKYLVAESLFEAGENDDGILGSIIDRGLSFIPRAMRFKKAKKIMTKALSKFTQKAKNIIKEFAKGFKTKVDTVDKEYQKFMKEKVNPLIEEDKKDEAVTLIDAQKKELETYKKEQIQILDKGIDDVLQSYTTAIHNRIDNPGFVLNVELSGKGKGELKAKWEELIAIQKMKIDETKTELITSSGWRRIDEMIAEMESFIKKNRSIKSEIEIFVRSAPHYKGHTNKFFVSTHVRAHGGREALKEKGLIIGQDPMKLEYGTGAKTVMDTSKYQYNVKPYELIVTAQEGEYVRPYLVFKDAGQVEYGDTFKLGADEAKTRAEDKEGSAKIKSDTAAARADSGSLRDEEPVPEKR